MASVLVVRPVAGVPPASGVRVMRGVRSMLAWRGVVLVSLALVRGTHFSLASRFQSRAIR
jgi:hypothetical protein